MRTALALLLLAHGVAHLPGFVSAWRIAAVADLPYHTAVLGGRVELGDPGMRVVGALWLAAAVGCWVAAAGALGQRAWWAPAAAGVALASLALCALEWPTTRLGVAVNVLVLGVLAVRADAGWLAAAGASPP